MTTEFIIKFTSIFVALMGLIYAWHKDLQLKKKSYADKIRNSAGEIIAKLERRKTIMLSFYEEIQPFITDADILLTESKNKIQTRDKFWKDINVVFNSIRLKIVDEKIEIAYVGLIGYDPHIMELYQKKINLLEQIDDEMKSDALLKTQDIISEQKKEGVHSAILGNQLRAEFRSQYQCYERKINSTVTEFNSYLIELIRKKDKDIYVKK